MTADNVAIFRKEKDENGNVLFTPCGYDKEKNLVTNSNNFTDLALQIKELINSGMRQTQISKKLGISQSKVSRISRSID